jgi:hypothetical protein
MTENDARWVFGDKMSSSSCCRRSRGRQIICGCKYCRIVVFLGFLTASIRGGGWWVVGGVLHLVVLGQLESAR